MNVIALQVFVSLMLVAGSIVLFLFSARQRDFEHADRLSLAPLEADTATAPDVAARAAESSPSPQPSTSPKNASEE